MTQAERAIRTEGERLVAAARDDYDTAAGALDKVNAGLAALEKDGELKKLVDTWIFGKK